MDVLRFVTDSWEMKAFVARSRTKAVGAMAHDNAHGGHFNKSVNLKEPPYNIGRTREDHSGAFTRGIQQVDALFAKLRATLEQSQ